MRAVTIVFLVLTGFLTGCTQFPELDQAIDPDVAARGVPDLIPLAPVLAAADTRATTVTVPDIAADLGARVANLRARADRLRGPVIPAPVRNRIARGIDTSALQ
jgi:hypothetical protein